MSDADRETRSLEEIEGDRWGEPPADATNLISTIYRLRRTPIDELGVEDTRALLNQGVGVDVLTPRVIPLLEQNPLLEGDFYPGDVLHAVLRIPREYWEAHPELLHHIRRVIDSVDAEGERDLQEDIGNFRRALGL